MRGLELIERARRRARRSIRMPWPAPARHARRCGGCRARRSAARARCVLLRVDLRRRLSPRSSRRTGARSSCRRCAPTCWSGSQAARPSGGRRRRSREPARSRSAARPATRPGLRCSSRPRPAKCSRPRCSLAGHETFSQRHTASSSSRCRWLPHSRARRRHHPRLRVGRPLAEDGTDDARNDVAGLLDDDPVAGADVLARDVVGVVQRRHRHGRAADEDRLEHGKRRHRSGAADVDRDLLQQRRLLLRRELERDRPARELARRAELRRRSSASTLMTTPSVSKPRVRRFSAHSAQNATSASMPRAACPVRLDRKSPLLSIDRVSRHATSGGPEGRLDVDAPSPADELIGERAAVRASRPATDRDSAARRPPRSAGSRTAARPPPRAPCSSSRTLPAADRPRPAPRCVPARVSRSRSGIARIVRTLLVTSSPVVPSPRVAARTSAPSS